MNSKVSKTDSPTPPLAAVANDQAGISGQRLMGIISSATDAIITVDAGQRIVLFNAAAEQMFRCPATEAIGSLLDRFIPERFRGAHREHVRAFGATAVATRAMGPRRELAAMRADGVEFPVEATISQINIDGQKLYTAIVRDIADLRRAEEELRDSEARLRAVFETAVDGIVTIDERGLVTSVNPAITRLFGYAPEEIMGRNVSMLMPEPYRSDHDRNIKSYLETGVKRVIGIGREVTGRRKDGTTFPMELAVSETFLSDRRMFTGVIHDISKRRRLEHEVLDVAAAEQRRIGQDLHDGLCQHLLATSLAAEVLSRRIAAITPDEAAAVSQIGQMVRDGIVQARALAHGLNPIDTRSGGLFASLQDLADRITAQCNIRCELDRDGIPPDVDSPGAALHLYRIAQEAISNAIKHGKSTRVFLRLRAADAYVVLSIEDNGVGISSDSGKGMGMQTMAHRAHVVGGYLTIEPAANGGTVVTCSLPNVRSVKKRSARELPDGK